MVASPGQVETQQNLFGPALARPGRPSPTTAPRGRTSSAKASRSETATWGAWWKTLVLGNVAGTADVAMQNVTAVVTCGSTAGLLISWTVGLLLHNFCCRGPILIPRPDSETSAQTTRTNVLDFFVKPKTGISASYTKRR